MRRSLPALMLVLLAAPAMPQDSESGKAPYITEEQLAARRALAALLRTVPGVRITGLGVVDDHCRVVVSCDGFASKEEARKRVGGDSFRGLDIVWSINPSGSGVNRPTISSSKPLPKPKPKPPNKGNSANDPHVPPWNAKATDCDIIRTYLKMKKVSHPAGGGRYWKPCTVNRRSVEGAGGGYTYEYTKHRGDCPIRLGRVGMPPWADHFIAWVFRKGFTPVARGGFLYPYGLRGDDKLWDRTASEDLKTRLPYIRDRAEWTYTPSGYVKTSSGTWRTGGHPGQSWAWNVPAPPAAGPAVATGCHCASCMAGTK